MSNTVLQIIGLTAPNGGNWLVQIILWLVQIGGSVAVGVILFTVFLKLITLPFDFISRYKMRKNSLIMEEMRPELEKLQRQYANDKGLYSQKMMALYKKNGYSMFGACLPTIITLVIFFIALSGFNNYSSFQNQKNFYDMSVSYDTVVYGGIETDGTIVKKDANGKIVIETETFKNWYNNVTGEQIIDGYKVSKDATTKSLTVNNVSPKNYVTLMINYNDDAEVKFNDIQYKLNFDNLSSEEVIKGDFNNNLKVVRYDDKFNETYYNYEEFKALFTDKTEQEIAETFIKEVRETVSAIKFRQDKSSFLWVKNIWVADSPLAHPVSDNPNSLKASGCGGKNMDVSNDNYSLLIGKLQKEKVEPNGYFIMVILAAGFSLLLQFLTSKSQKAQMELQTVDGQGARTQKMMTWMMPIMMAIFSFFYTAAFSVYMIISSAISIATMFLINWIVNLRFKKINAGKNQTIRGRVYVPETPEVPEKPAIKPEKKNDFIKVETKIDVKAEKKKKKDKNETPGKDFFGNDAKNHIRGRLK